MELNFSNQEIIAAKKRAGPKSSAQTPAKPSERRKGSDKNKKGSAGKDGPSITFSASVINALKNKVTEHNKKYSRKVTLGQLKKVYRRGAGAFSSSHRPGKSRGQWAMARVNTFLKMMRGGKVKDSYKAADQDIAKGSIQFLFIEASNEEWNPTEEELIAARLELDEYSINDAYMSEIDWDYVIKKMESEAEDDEEDDMEKEGEDEDEDEDMDDEDEEDDMDEDGEEVTAEVFAAEEKSGKKLNKPFRTPKGPKKFSVYVKNDKGNVVKVNFGDPNMDIKRDDPNRRKSFRARHQCDTNPGPKWKARYWSCRMWESGKSVSDYTK